jgi:hypothetical protein
MLESAFCLSAQSSGYKFTQAELVLDLKDWGSSLGLITS